VNVMASQREADPYDAEPSSAGVRKARFTPKESMGSETVDESSQSQMA
jgi:hypothetical protein